MKRVWTYLLIAMIAALAAAGCAKNDGEPPAPPAAQTPDSPADGQTAPPNAEERPAPKPQPTAPGKKFDNPPAMAIDTKKTYTAILHTSMGDITIQLYPQDAPKTVNNFVFLARNNFYDNVTFHRVMKTFMIQTGDPLGTGVGGPGYVFEDELESVKKHAYEPGVVAMANAGPNTNGSQFFIGSGDDVRNLKHFPKYTIFGKVIAGMDVVQKIASVPTKVNPVSNENSMPVEPVVIKDVTITEK